MPPPPRKPTSPRIERGGGDVENDPERLQGTQAKVKIPAVSRERTGEAVDDPEQRKGTQAKIEGSRSQAAAPQEADEDAEESSDGGKQTRAEPRASRSPSNWEAPPGRMSREARAPKVPLGTGVDY